VENLGAASREELIAIVEALLARVAELEEEVRRLRQGKGGGAGVAVKPSRLPREKRERKRRDGAFVRRREPPDEVVHHTVERCPDCGRELHGGWEHDRRQVIEVVMQRRVIDHVMWARRCGVCRKRILPKLEASELGVQGQRRFGASVQSLVATLHIGCRVPIRMIGALLWELFGLRVSEGEVVKLLDGLKRAGEPALEGLREQVRAAPAVCGDETGWRQDGENGYLWGFFTEKARYFEYRKSRSAQVPKEILGEEFGGTLTCDFYAAYNWVGVLQRCWPHLLRDARELAELNADRPEVGAWVEALGALYREAKGCCFALGELAANSGPRQRERRRLERLAAKLAAPYVNHPEAPQRVLAQRILKHLSELFVFISDPAVPATNNLAERSLRPAVVARKISGGTRSPKGSDTRMGLMSLLGTWQAQGKGLVQGCRELLLPTPAP
jgi:DNA-directed RNA polymerase subunit N (RpoN/RPB10)